MSLPSKVLRLVRSPSEVTWLLRCRGGNVAILLRRGKLLAAGLVFLGTFVNRFDRMLENRIESADRYATCQVGGSTMVVDLEDGGLSRDLYLYNVREKHTTEIYQRELRAVDEAVDGPIRVVEIGANIGYFVLKELEVLDARASVLAFEPDERNVALLEENVARNGFDERVRIEPAAVGPDSGTTTMVLSSHSNLNRVESSTEGTPQGETIGTRDVRMWSLDDYLADRSIRHDDVHVIRMDLEGFEVEVVAGMERVLDGDGTLLLFVEMHPHLLSEARTETLLDTLERSGFSVVSVVIEGAISVLGFTERNEDVTFRELRDIGDRARANGHGYRLFLKRSA